MFRIAIGQVRPDKGDYVENLRLLGGVMAQVAGWDHPPDLLVFPETIMSGYFVEGGVRELAVTAGTLFRDLAMQHSLSGAPPLDVALGFYEEFSNRYYNSAMYGRLGGSSPGIRHVHRKIFLPTYGVFDEERFVDGAHRIQAFDTTWGRAALLICEDAWHSIVPTFAALDGAQLLMILSAAPARGPMPGRPAGEGPKPGAAAAQEPWSGAGPPDADGGNIPPPGPATVERWERLVRGIAEEHGVFVALAQLVGFEGGKGLQGSSAIIGPRGEVIARGPVFEEAVVTADLDLNAITRARADQPLLADLEAEWPHFLSADGRATGPVTYDPEDQCPPAQRPPVAAKHLVVGAGPVGDPLALDPGVVERWLVAFVRDEVLRGRGYQRVIVALSGGVDSALTAFLAARAMGAANVIGVRLPYRTSSPESLHHAELVAKQLGIELRTVDITRAVDGYVDVADPEADPARRGNVQARVRMLALFDLSAKLRALPLGTSNKSERLLGYFTWHADDAPPLNPLGDLFKTQVTRVARHVGVPEPILAKPATADLVAGQTDEGDLGMSYDTADHILYWILQGFDNAAIVGRGFSADEVALVRRRVQSTHWKRRLPTVAMLSNTAVGEYYLRPVDY